VQQHQLEAGYGTVWIDVEDNPSTGCSWKGHTAASNCDFLMELIDGLKSKGKHVGVYTSQGEWSSVMGSQSACTKAAGEPLWYAHYDNSKSFGDYHKIGGWSKPTMKQFSGTGKVCGVGADLNWY
jgi:GH25 family lysozyme M1 (1,4-beta-N-acetylmuramidase)